MERQTFGCYRPIRVENLKGEAAMDPSAELDELLSICRQAGLDVRYADLGGDGGGLCRIRDKEVLFVDAAADPQTRLRRTVESVADLSTLDRQYMHPRLRERLDATRRPVDDQPV